METLYFGKTFDEIFDKHFKVFTRGIEEHNFKHFNHSLGCWIYSKEHLKQEMKNRRMLPYDICEELAEEWDRKHEDKPYELTNKTENLIKSIRLTADKNGNIKLGDRAINALIEMGAVGKVPDRELTLQSGWR